MNHFRKLLVSLLVCALVVPLMVTSVFAQDNTVIVTTNPGQGWHFNPDPANVTPAEFTDAQASIGNGSIHAKPISSTPPAAKFILQYTPSSPFLVADFESFSIDFLIDDADASQVNQFYINLYTLTPTPDNQSFYDCRFDYVASSGSISDWTELEFNSGDAANSVADQWGTGVCPASPADMPEGSTIFRIAFNIGDTTASDSTVGGYVDNAQLTVDGSTTTFDFEPYKVATTKDDCKDGGWQDVTDDEGNPFKNQGDCIQFVNTGK